MDSDGTSKNNDLTDKINQKKKFWNEKLEQLNSSIDLSNLSKNQQKKLLKKKVHDELRGEKRKKERERKKLKRAQLREAGIPLPESRKSKKRRGVAFSNYKVAIDLDFYDSMNDKDLRMLLKQVKTCYSVNRSHASPVQLTLTSFNDKLKNLFLKLQPGLVNWNVQFKDLDYLNVFDKEKIVYLSSDSDNVLDSLDEEKIYIIGGLVDHNHHKGLCHRMATEKNVAHARLPIGEFVKMNSRKVLTINHVFEILLEFSESGDWKSAFFNVLPNRKGVSNIEEKTEEEGENNESDLNDSDDSCESTNISDEDVQDNKKDVAQ